ncbi:MAG: Omp28-related outer membrane protein [Bacteroidales bacterium]|nr:Omp28-related outer membrane protein [Bacteroidales bacterium]
MKKRALLLISFITAGFSFIQAQTLVSTNIEKKNVILEEYTGIHCVYCPEGHAIAQAMYDANPYDVVLINIHTGGYAAPYSGEPDFRTTYGDVIAADPEVQIGGYPNGSVNRHFFADLTGNGGTSMGRSAWETAAGRVLKEDSPVNVGASTSYNTTTRELTINVELYYTSDAPAASNFLNIALIQNGILGPQTGGGLGDNYVHNHMLRDLITGQWGEEITTTTSGTFIQRTYTYTVPNDFISVPCIVDNCDIAVFVTEDHQEIYSGIQIPAINGTTYVIGSYTNLSEIIQEGITGNNSSFSFDFTNGFLTNEDFTFTLTKENEPADWSSNFTVSGNTYTGTGTETINGSSTEAMTIDITPGASAGFVKYILTAVSVNNPNLQSKKIEVYVIANTGTLLIHNSGSWSTGSPVDFEDEYFAGFDYASVEDYTSCKYNMFMIAAANNKLDNIHTIFFNVAWTFPGINEEITAELTSFLDNGGNLFIAGQDLGWDTWENTGTTITQAFYTNYLNASFNADGSTSNNSISPNPNDDVFGYLNTSSLVNIYGGTNMFPDEMSAVGYGNVFLYYLNNSNKGAAIKSTNGNYKVVYLGFDIPMVSDVSVRNEIIKKSIDWFNGVVSTSNIINTAGINVYPNPASNLLTITTSNISDILISDISGKLLYSEKGSKKFEVNVSNFTKGVYFVKIKNGGSITIKKFVVIQ